MIHGRLKNRTVVILLLIFLCTIFINNAQSMPKCSYGSLDAWISLDNSNWVNTTVTNLSLQSGQPFFVKTMMKPFEDEIYLALYLSEPGASTKSEESFIILEGPCGLNDGVDLGKTNRNETKMLTWKLQVKNDPSWIGGYTPLSVTGFFQKRLNDEWLNQEISFSIANIHLISEEWIESNQQKITKNDVFAYGSSSIISFVPVLIVLFLVLILLFWKKTR